MIEDRDLRVAPLVLDPAIPIFIRDESNEDVLVEVDCLVHDRAKLVSSSFSAIILFLDFTSERA